MKTIGFIGGGRITRILLNGFKNADSHFKEIAVYDTNEPVLKTLKAEYPQIEISSTDFSKAAAADWVFIALHPPVLMETLTLIKDHLKKESLIISLAPKVTLDKMKTILPENPNLARMNPNAGTYIGKGFNPVCFAPSTDKKVIDSFVSEFVKLGKVPVVPENQIEAYAIVSAMGHTYFWFQLQQLKELGLSFGLSERETNEALYEMWEGTAACYFNAGLSYEKVIDLVPVKPLAEHEETIKAFYLSNLNGLFQKIKPQ